MKNIIVSALFTTFILFSCTKTNNTNTPTSTPDTKSQTVAKPAFSIDSIKVHDSLSVNEMLTAEFEAGVLLFPTLTDMTLLDSIYAKEQLNLNQYDRQSLTRALRDSEQNYYNETKKNAEEYSPTFHQTWNRASDMDLVSNEDGLMTIKYSGSGYTGGAHGYYYEFYKVFDLATNKTLQLKDIVENRDEEVWNEILKDNFLKEDLERGQADMLLVQEIPLNDNFYLDREHLYFLYNQYEIAAYAAGPILIKVPLKDIKPFLTKYVKERLKI